MPETHIEILLVEDTRSDAEMTIRAIRKNNIVNNIIHLTDGAAALEFIFGNTTHEGQVRKPKVILLDLKMPKVSGIEVLERIKADERTKNIPVVVLTSSRESPDIERCYQLGVNSYIVKPVATNDFMEVVSQLGLYWVLHNNVPDSI